MTRAFVLLLCLAVVAPIVAWQAQTPPGGPMPQIQNGRVETRRGPSIDREIAAVSAPGAEDPVWVAWRVPMVAGDRDMCGWYGDRMGTVRAMFIDDGRVSVYDTNLMPSARPQITPPTGPIPLEAGTNLIVLARVVGGRVERLRTAGDDCPMDAGGRTVYWLDAVTPAESLRFLGALAEAGPTDRTLPDIEQHVAETAVRALGYHRDAGADAALDRLATGHRDAGLRRQAASTLASLRGAHGVATITRLLERAADADDRRSLTSALGQSHDTSAVGALRALTRDPEARVRAEAAHWFVQRGGTAVIPEALKIIASDTDDAVRRRTIASIGRLPGESGIPHLLQLARTTDNGVVRKEAVSALSRSQDPRALAYMEEILKR